MLTKELEALKQTEQHCKDLLGQAEKQRLQIEAEARQEAEREYRRQEEAAHREGESRLERARLEAEEAKRARLQERDEELARMRAQSEARIHYAATKILERMCSGDDCADEPFQPFGAQTG